MKKAKAILFTFLIICSAIIIGLTINQIVNPPVLYANTFCECAEEECELGFICVDNVGENTWCDELDENECKTRACCDIEEEG